MKLMAPVLHTRPVNSYIFPGMCVYLFNMARYLSMHRQPTLVGSPSYATETELSYICCTEILNTGDDNSLVCSHLLLLSLSKSPRCQDTCLSLTSMTMTTTAITATIMGTTITASLQKQPRTDCHLFCFFSLLDCFLYSVVWKINYLICLVFYQEWNYQCGSY